SKETTMFRKLRSMTTRMKLATVSAASAGTATLVILASNPTTQHAIEIAAGGTGGNQTNHNELLGL
ncbi:hypothetical protein, partial [Streptomyces sp. NPDC047028]|uniref:hypothetical protein n=1 Tax=Streptomyces sp. NPDC047028 TaxID=3155793 RepID=UPI0033D1CE9E